MQDLSKTAMSSLSTQTSTLKKTWTRRRSSGEIRKAKEKVDAVFFSDIKYIKWLKAVDALRERMFERMQYARLVRRISELLARERSRGREWRERRLGNECTNRKGERAQSRKLFKCTMMINIGSCIHLRALRLFLLSLRILFFRHFSLISYFNY